MAGGRRDSQCRQQADDVRDVIRRDVQHHAGGYDVARDAMLLERLCDKHGAADAGRRQRLIHEELHKAELVDELEPDAMLRDAHRRAEHFTLRQIRQHLKDRGEQNPFGLRRLYDAKEILGFREMKGNDDDDDEDGGAEHPR